MLEIQYHLREIREDKDISIRQLSKMSGVSRTQISDIELEHKHPTLYTLWMLALALDVPVRDLYTIKLH